MEYDLANCDEDVELPSRGDILKNAVPTLKEVSRMGDEVFVFYPPIFHKTKGIIYPNDDVVFLNEPCDVIITNLYKKGGGFLLMSEVYHEFSVGDILPVRISRFSDKYREPMFKLFGFFGFVKNENLDLEQRVYVKVNDIKRGTNGKSHILKTSFHELMDEEIKPKPPQKIFEPSVLEKSGFHILGSYLNKE